MRNDIENIQAEIRLEIESYSSANESVNNDVIFNNIIKNMAYINKQLDSEFKLGRFKKINNKAINLGQNNEFTRVVRGLDVHTQMMINGYEEYMLYVDNISISVEDNLFFLVYRDGTKKQIKENELCPETFVSDGIDFVSAIDISSTIIPDENKVFKVYLSTYGKYFVVELKQQQERKK